MDKGIAIKVENVSKTFRIPHEKISSLRGAFVNLFRTNGYEEFKALDGVSFEVKKGEFFGIIGRNGSGKSTLLKILAGIYQPDSGRVKVNGLISPFLELGIGFNPELSGRDNIYLNASVLGLTHKQIDEKFDDIVRFSELRRFIDQKVKNYSSGMQVRLAFSVAIHANRDILLMDEVLAVGDTNFQNKCLAEFKRYRDLGKTVILVTHDIVTMQRYCDRAMLLRNGKIMKIGDPQLVGNEYLDQSITDQGAIDKHENSRDKKKKNSANMSGKKIFILKRKAEILGYNFFDHKNNETLKLESGKEFKVRLKIKFNENISNAAFGVMFRDVSNSLHFGLHNIFTRNPCELKNAIAGDIYEILLIDKMILVSGTYSVSIACSSQKSYYEYESLDIVSKPINIQVYSEGLFWGMINSDVNIQIKKIN